MRATRYHEHGGPAVLQVDEVDEPSPGVDEVVVAVSAAAVNPVDTYFREGTYPVSALPMTPGVDAAGRVVAVGAGVDDYAVDDRVVATGLSRDRQGACAERVAVPTDRLAHLPDEASMTEAGAVGVVGVTAYRALIDDADLAPGETVLVHGGSGGVGHVAVQIGAATGARVVATAAPEYHDAVEGLGADSVFDYARDDLAEVVHAATGGVDVVLDHRLDDYLQFDAEVGAAGVRVVGIGENDPEASFDRIGVARSKDVRLHLTSMFNTPSLARVLDRVATLLGRGDLTVEVEETYDLDEVDDAHRDVMRESFLGKLVVVP